MAAVAVAARVAAVVVADEPPEPVGQPFAFGQSRIAVRQPALDARGQSSQRQYASQHGRLAQRRHPSQHGHASQHRRRGRRRDPPEHGGSTLEPRSAELLGHAQTVHGRDCRSAGARPGGSNLGAAVGAGVAGGAAAAFLQNGGGAGRPAAGQLPAGENRAGRVENRADIAGNRTDRAETRTDRVESRTDRAGDRQANRPERIENRQEYRDNRVERRGEILDQVHNHPVRDFWSEYPGWAALRITRPYRWATWGAITGWVGYGWSDSVAYSYGDNVYYEGDSVYYGDQVVATAEEYTQQAEEIAASAPEVAPDKAEWMPLGVFALTPDGQKSGPDPTAVPAAGHQQGGDHQRHAEQHGHRPDADDRRHGGQGVPAGGLDRGRQDAADHGNRHCQSDRGHRAGAGPFRRRPDPAMADGAAGRAGGPTIAMFVLVGLFWGS